jgi:hypothetical protein
MTAAAVYHFLPGCGLVLTPRHVAEATVAATIRGIYRFQLAILAKMLPNRATMLLAALGAGDVSFLERLLGDRLSQWCLSSSSPPSSSSHRRSEASQTEPECRPKSE